VSHEWDEFSKALAGPVPRREALRRLGFVFAGAVLAPLGLGTARAGGTDRCRSFCDKCPRARRSSCLTACRACGNSPGHLCGDCAGGFRCTDFQTDVRNCGACNNDCWVGAGANEEAACLDGACFYRCVAGAAECGGTCTFLNSDPDNCGACGNVCPAAAPDCVQGVCSEPPPPPPECPPGLTWCQGQCVDLLWDHNNCGACNHQCSPFGGCSLGQCEGAGGGGW
jgi:hypothetical protein